VLSHVPGGLGVFDGVMLRAFGSQAPMESILGALILFRGVYFLLPLALAILLLVNHELHRATDSPVGRAAAHLSPLLLAILAFMAGVWLLLSGVTPTTAAAQDLLALRVPLVMVEAAHLIGSLVGLALLFIARGLLHRLDAAWWAALVLTVLAAALALPKGIAWVEALILTGLGGLLWLFRAEFNRRSSLLAQSFETEWLIAVTLMLGAMVWLLFLAYRDVDYAHALWWQFAFDAHVSRSLRAVTVVMLCAAALGLWQLFRPAGAPAEVPMAQALDQAAAIVRGQDSAEACLALMGDKSLLFSTNGTAFIMYGQKGRSWVALSDPVGDPAEGPNLVWRFVELASAHGGRAVFYQVTPGSLPWYLDAGLRVFKLGEAAHVPLGEFSLKGPQRAPLRHADSRAQREGLSVEILAPDEVSGVLAEIQTISDVWLANQSTREKSFSLGAFDPVYLQRLPLALVRQGGRIVAFANLLLTDTRQEVRIDLMRYLPDAPPSTMDFLLIRLMLHYQAEGVARFGLGMAPLAGIAQHERAPTWQQKGRLFFEHGERFYNFEGVRRFKEKFNPVWEPRYLAAPGGLAPLMALADIATLISGGLRGVVTK
jgi:phosphatidylglycerol lysyltransferase